MAINSLASSRKAWRLIQSLISRVVTNGKENLIGGDDLLKIQQPINTHPFKVHRAGNIVGFQPGLVSSFTVSARPSTWVITDRGGFDIPSFPAWVVIRITTSANPPYLVTNSAESFYVVQTGGQTILPTAEISAPLGFLGNYSIVGQFAQESQIAVPICYLTETTTHQLLKTNISIMPQANHHNLLTYL